MLTNTKKRNKEAREKIEEGKKKYRDTEIPKDRETEIPKYRKTERPKYRKTTPKEKQKGGATER